MLTRIDDEVALGRRSGGELPGEHVRVDPVAVAELVRVRPRMPQLVEPLRPLWVTGGRMVPRDLESRPAELTEIGDDRARRADSAHLSGVAVDLVDRPSLGPGVHVGPDRAEVELAAQDEHEVRFHRGD